MKRADIRAGVVYAIKSSYGPPAPIVFLEDGAAGLYGRGSYGSGPVRKLTENKHARARRASGYSDTDCGYAAMKVSWHGDTSFAVAAEQMRSAEPEAELARFLADERPSADGLGFEIVTSLGQISGLYDEELAAYNARVAAERDAEQRRKETARAESARRRGIVEALSTFGIGAKDNTAGKVELSLEEAGKLLALLRDLVTARKDQP